MPTSKYKQAGCAALLMVLFVAVYATSATGAFAQVASSSLTPLQLKIEKQRLRLNSTDEEERRDAVSQLGAMQHPDASRAGVAGLQDASPSVRATAASSILSLSGEEAAASLIPLLSDKDEFVRREVAYALGKTRSRSGVQQLIEALLTDKQDGVRGAAAVALGEIGDASAVPSLAAVLRSQSIETGSKKKSKSKKEQNPFVLRAAAHSLGQIGDRDAVPALVAVLGNEKTEDDVRRESADALGLIGDPSAIPALRAAVTATDPYLSKAAHEAIQAILKLKD
jgi:HEAT repeat protein